VVCRLLRFLLPCIMAANSIAQDPPSQPQQSALVPESVALGEVSSVQIPSLPAESVAAPLLCDAQGRILFRLATPEAGIEDPVSVSGDGRTVVRFAKEKINDVPRPVMLSVFLAGSDVYILTSGSTPLDSTMKLRKPNGEVIEQQASKRGMFVVHFQPDGN
jgi:hypothetical protein